MSLRAPLLLAAALACAACSGAPDARPVSDLSPHDPDPILALTADGDVLYAARATRLERVDRATGAVTQVAGPEYAACPTHPDDAAKRWQSTPLDFGYPGIAVHGGVVYLSAPECGLFAFDLASRTSRMLLRGGGFDPSQPPPPFDAPPPPLRWSYPWPLVFQVEDDGILACLRATHDSREHDESGDPLHDRVELWSFALDDYALWSVARKADSFGHFVERLLGLRDLVPSIVADEGSVYVNDQSEILRVPKEHPFGTVVLVDSPGPAGKVRSSMAIHGGHLYWFDGFAIQRLAVPASPLDARPPVETIAAGDQDDGAWPVRMFVTDADVTFARFTTARLKTLDGAPTDAFDFWLARVPTEPPAD